MIRSIKIRVANNLGNRNLMLVSILLIQFHFTDAFPKSFIFINGMVQGGLSKPVNLTLGDSVSSDFHFSQSFCISIKAVFVND